MRLNDYLLVYWNFNFALSVHYCEEMPSSISVIKNHLPFLQALQRQLFNKLQLLVFAHRLIIIFMAKLHKEVGLFLRKVLPQPFDLRMLASLN
jgi:hypothetical protein